MGQLKLNIYKGSRGGRHPGSGIKRISSKGVAKTLRNETGGKLP